MKKAVLTIGAMMIAASTFAQGTVGMANTAAALVRQWTSASDSTPISVAANVGNKIEFLWAPLGTTDINLFQTVAGATPVNIAPTPGRFSSATAITVPGIPAGGVIAAVLRGWTGAYLTYGEALTGATGFAGYSSIFQVDTGDPTAVPAGTPGNVVSSMPGNGFTGILLPPVPEPTTFALAGLGAVTMLVFRRRK